MNNAELKKAARELANDINERTPESVGYVLVLHDFRGEPGKQTAIESNFATQFIPVALQLTANDLDQGITDDVGQVGSEPNPDGESNRPRARK